jgi:SAM-dependent methyltransferase
MSAAAQTTQEALWHDVECGGYAQDLPLWERLAGDADGPILDLGCGTGRVALHLARRGADVRGVDSNPALIAALRERAEREGLAVSALCADVREASLEPRSCALALAPMQLLQMLGGPTARAEALRATARALAPGALMACAIVEDYAEALGEAGVETLPDVREEGGWIYSSLPIAVALTGEALEVRRLRQVVSPDGGLSETRHTDRLDLLDAPTLEREGAAAGLAAAGRLRTEQSELHVGSTVVLLRREG